MYVTEKSAELNKDEKDTHQHIVSSNSSECLIPWLKQETCADMVQYISLAPYKADHQILEMGTVVDYY